MRKFSFLTPQNAKTNLDMGSLRNKACYSLEQTSPFKHEFYYPVDAFDTKFVIETNFTKALTLSMPRDVYMRH